MAGNLKATTFGCGCFTVKLTSSYIENKKSLSYDKLTAVLVEVIKHRRRKSGIYIPLLIAIIKSHSRTPTIPI